MSRDLIGLDTVIGAFYATAVVPAPAPTTYTALKTMVAPAPAPTYVAPKTTVAPVPAPAPTSTYVAPVPAFTPTPVPTTYVAPVPVAPKTVAPAPTPTPIPTTYVPVAPKTIAPALAYVAPKPALTPAFATVATPVTPTVSKVPTQVPVTPQKAAVVVDAAAEKAAAAAKAKANVKVKRQNDVAQVAQKLNAVANKTRRSKRANRLRSIAKAVALKVQISGDPFSSMLGELVGLDRSARVEIMNLNVLDMSPEEWINYLANIDAVIICNGIAEDADALIEKLKVVNLTDLVNRGINIANAADDIVNNFDPDKNVGSQVNALREGARVWTADAQAALANPTTTTPGEGGETLPPLEEPAGGAGGGGSSDGGGGGGFGEGGGEEQTFEQVDAPEPEAADEPLPPVTPGLEFGGGGGSGSLNEDGGEEEYTAEEEVVETAQGYVDEATVKATQQALIDKGYDLGETGADGIYNEPTALAVGQLQVAEGLAETGVIDDDVLNTLGVPIPAPPTPPVAEGGDLFAAIVGELYGRKVVGSAVKVPVRVTKSAPPQAKTSAFKGWLTKPMWTGSRVLVWHGAVGAGAAVTLSGILLVVLRRKR